MPFDVPSDLDKHAAWEEEGEGLVREEEEEAAEEEDDAKRKKDPIIGADPRSS